MGSNTKWYFYTNALIREFIANLVQEKNKHISLLVITNMFTIGLVLIGYYYSLINLQECLMKKIIITVICCLLLIGCGNTNEVDKRDEMIKTIIDGGNYIIVDVRTKEEYDEGHVVDAINIPVDEINDEIDLDKNKTIFVYCRSGKRSSQAYSKLKNYGYNVIDLGAYDSIDLDKTSQTCKVNDKKT